MPIEADVVPLTLYDQIKDSLKKYLIQFEDMQLTDIYPLVLQQVELALLEVIMKHAYDNQSRAAVYLGLSRGTLRKKLQQHGLIS